ncbi:hypothetical protein EC968_007417 [Mortierella alpina]|nr:hypothetical protein EC968_007417 [Mortierella alpina]
MTTFITTTQRRPGGKDEPEDLRQLRREHGNSLLTLKELFADWSEEDLLYAIQDAGGDVELAIVRISEGHAPQWGEVKGKKKTPKPKTTFEKQDFRSGSQRGGFADRGSRGRGDGFRGGRAGSTRGGPRAQNGGDRHTRPAKAVHTTATSESAPLGWSAESIDGATEDTPSWADATAAATDSPSLETSSGWAAASSTSDPWSSTAAATDSNGTAAAPATDAWSTTPAASSADPWSTSAATTSSTTDVTNTTSTATPARKINTATIPAGSKMSWAKIVKPAPAPAPAPVAPPKSIPAPAHAPAPKKETKPTAPAPAPVHPEPEPVVDHTPEPTPVEKEVKVPEEKVVETVPEVEQTIEEPAAPSPAPTPEPKHAHIAAESPVPAATAPVGPPGLKQKTASQARRLNQDAPVVMPGGSASLQSVGVKFGSFSLNDDVEPAESESQPETSSQQTATSAQPAPQQAQSTPAAQSAQSAQPTAPTQTSSQQPSSAYGRQPSTGAAGYPGATPVTNGQSPAGASANAAYLKQDPAANYLGQHHHHPGMGHDVMGSPYGSYMPAANQLGSFGMPPMATLPNEYAALYGNDLQRAMYYDPANYGQMPGAVANNYQTRDSKYNQDSATPSATGTTGAANSGTTQAQQTLQQQQQQQQQQQAYPNMAGGLPYYPYYYMPNQFPNAYQQSGYGQPFVNKNMYPMYQQHQQPQPQQQHGSSKPGTTGAQSTYGSFSGTGAGQGGHHQYSQSAYDDISGAGLHGLANDPYAKYGNTGGYLAGQQQTGSTGTTANGGGKGTGGVSGTYSEKGGSTGAGGAQTTASTAGGASHQTGGANQYPGQQGYYQQQQMFSNYQQYPSHHQGYHPNQQHQGQHHQASGRNNSSNNNQQQQFWSQN